MKIITQYQICFLLIGLINNSFYVLILSCAQDLSAYFHQQSFMSLFGFALIVPTIGIVILNATYFLKTSHKKRIVFALVANALAATAFGIFSIFSPDKIYAFYICVSASLICGATQGIGQSVMIAFIKKFPSECVSGWSSGTGFAGIFGSGIYLALKSLRVSNRIIFFSMIPFIILYGVLFIWLDNHKPNDATLKLSSNQQESLTVNQNLADTKQSLDANDQILNKQLNWTNSKLIIKKIWFSFINIGLVFYLQYTILTCFADVINRQSNLKPNSNYFQKHAYQILSFCYQIGVFISRSSLYCFIIKKWNILTILQGANFVGWFIASFFSVNIYIQFIWMIFVGLNGGSSYVNIYYSILNNEQNLLEADEKELAVNLIVLSTDFFSTFATLTSLLLSNTLYRNK